MFFQILIQLFATTPSSTLIQLVWLVWLN